ncbi:UbiA family prenyltransferase [Thiobacillus sp.]|uniref:UbiA family prenyltransferase n=1 Tax=Thiobacillus sp. TaxID=924 RepID=UPI00286DB4E0|nr:UbiA family prenyltransferase [Thiobacillus sp.]
MHSSHPTPPTTPLFVDLDGTLTPTDTLLEGAFALIRKQPSSLLKLPFWLLRGRAALKANIARDTRIDAANLPYHASLLDYLREQRAGGRRIYLATASHQQTADAVANHLELFDGVIASDASSNLKGRTKLAAIQSMAGGDFAYAGDAAADLPIWQQAQAAILVGTSPKVGAEVRLHTPVEAEFSHPRADLRVWLRALRIHQWLKNLLIFVPLLTAFSFFDLGKLGAALLAFVSFSLAASATYLLNDLWDLDNDRVHPRKRSRPFASGRLGIPQGLGAAALMLTAALAMAGSVSGGFLAMLLVYLVATSAYSWRLKQYVLIDVLTLSLLYTLRILAGAVAINVATSPWLLAFSVFLFLSLALIKRCSELISLEQLGQTTTRGRDYRVSDQQVLTPLGVAAALSAVVIFGLFITTPDTTQHYTQPQLLWFTGVGLIYWLARLWIKTVRGEMHDDPIIFALKDFGSQVTIAIMLAATLAARFLPIY